MKPENELPPQTETEALAGEGLASPPCPAFDRARLNDPIVHRGMQAGCDYEEIIAKMFERHEAMTAKLMELEMIAPRRIRVGDHDMVYHTPDHLIPLQNAGADRSEP